MPFVVRKGTPAGYDASMTFTLAWVDQDQEARNRAHDLLVLFNQPGSRDEMGLGTIRDAFSNLLFPGTNTAQTRLRFWLIVPWVYRALEREGMPRHDFWRLGRERELDVLEHLWETSEDGVYGRRSGRRLKGIPSWYFGLGDAWGLRVHAAGSGNGARTWHAGLPTPPHGFPKLDTLSLTAPEAEYLQDRVAQSVPQSLLAHLFRQVRAKNAGEADGCGFVWEHPRYADFAPEHKEQVEHARLFSEVIYGAPVLYNLLLARRVHAGTRGRERAGRGDEVADYEGQLAKWSRGLDRSALTGWSVDDFWATVARSARINHGTRAFVSEWIALVRAGELDVGVYGAPAGDSAAAKLVRRREKTLKGARSRFRNEKMLAEWRGGSGMYRLGYRWKVVRGFLRELGEGLAASA